MCKVYGCSSEGLTWGHTSSLTTLVPGPMFLQELNVEGLVVPTVCGINNPSPTSTLMVQVNVETNIRRNIFVSRA